MTQAASKTITVDEFIKKYGDNERYELIDRELIANVYHILMEHPNPSINCAR
jgi:hypothetical protein